MAAFLLLALAGAVLRSPVDAAADVEATPGQSGLAQTAEVEVSRPSMVSKYFKMGARSARSAMARLSYFKGGKTGSACESLPGKLLPEDSESPLGMPGETVPYRNQLLFEFSTEKVPLGPEEDAAWQMLEKEAFAQGAIGTCASIVSFDQDFTSQTGGASSREAAERNRKTFVGLWTYLTLASGSKELAKYVRTTAAELWQEQHEKETEENLGIDEAMTNKDTTIKLWFAALLKYMHLESDVFELHESAISNADAQAEVLRTLAWPLVRRWLVKKHLVAGNGYPIGGYWKCFAELIGGEKSWVVQEVDELRA